MRLCLCSGLAIAKRLMPFGVKRLLYSGRTAKSYAAEVNGEFGKKKKRYLHREREMIKSIVKNEWPGRYKNLI